MFLAFRASAALIAAILVRTIKLRLPFKFDKQVLNRVAVAGCVTTRYHPSHHAFASLDPGELLAVVDKLLRVDDGRRHFGRFLLTMQRDRKSGIMAQTPQEL